MHKPSKTLAIVLIASLSIITTLPSFATAQDIPEKLTTQENPDKDLFFGLFDKDMKKGKRAKAVESVPFRIVGAPFKALYGLWVTGKRTGNTITHGTDDQKDSGSAIAGRVILSPFIYSGHLVKGIGKYVKENPIQAVLDAAALSGIGYRIAEATEGKNTNRSGGGDDGGDGGGGDGGPHCGSPPCGCFAKDTKVKMAVGNFKQIAEIKVGEEVQSFDFKKNRVVNSKVIGMFAAKTDSFLFLNELKVTEKHPFAVGVDKWEEAGKLKVGDQVLGNGNITIKNIKRVSKPVQVFNMTVNGTHNYYVHDGENKFLVHNKGQGLGCFIKESEVLMADKSKKKIEDIKVGDEVLGFNLETKKWNKYHVTELQGGKDKKGYFLINKKLKVSPVHRIYVNGKRKTSSEIKLNDIIINGHKETKVTSIQFIDKKADRHNIVLGKNKNILYFVNDVLVYNGWE